MKLKKIGEYSLLLYFTDLEHKIIDFNTLKIFSSSSIVENVYDFNYINETYYISGKHLYIMSKENTINNYDLNGNNILLKSSISDKCQYIPKDILISRCYLFEEINNLYDLYSNNYDEYSNEYFENIDIYVEFIKTGKIDINNIEKLISICLYLQDYDLGYIIYYLINNYTDINKALLILFENDFYGNFKLLLNNYLDNLSIIEYNKFINECEPYLYKYILKINSKKFIK